MRKESEIIKDLSTPLTNESKPKYSTDYTSLGKHSDLLNDFSEDKPKTRGYRTISVDENTDTLMSFNTEDPSVADMPSRMKKIDCFVKACQCAGFLTVLLSGGSGFSSGKTIKDWYDDDTFINIVGGIAATTFSLFNLNSSYELINGDKHSIKRNITSGMLAAVSATPSAFLTFKGLNDKNFGYGAAGALSLSNYCGTMLATMNAMVQIPCDKEFCTKQLTINIMSFVTAAYLLCGPTATAAVGLGQAIPALKDASLFVMGACNLLSASIFSKGLVDFYHKFPNCAELGEWASSPHEMDWQKVSIKAISHIVSAITALTFAALMPSFTDQIYDNEVFRNASIALAAIVTTIVWGDGLDKLLNSFNDYLNNCCKSDAEPAPLTPELTDSAPESNSNDYNTNLLLSDNDIESPNQSQQNNVTLDA